MPRGHVTSGASHQEMEGKSNQVERGPHMPAALANPAEALDM